MDVFRCFYKHRDLVQGSEPGYGTRATSNFKFDVHIGKMTTFSLYGDTKINQLIGSGMYRG